ASAALRLIEFVLRSNTFERCEDLLNEFRQHYASHTHTVGDQRLLEAQLMLRRGDTRRARNILNGVLDSRFSSPTQRATAWTLVARCDKMSANDALARAALASAKLLQPQLQDGFAIALMHDTEEQLKSVDVPLLPFQQRSPNFDVDANLTEAEMLVIEAAHKAY